MNSTKKVILLSVTFLFVGFAFGLIVANSYENRKFLEKEKHIVEVLNLHKNQRKIILDLKTESGDNLRELLNVLRDSPTPVQEDSLRAIMERSIICLNHNTHLMANFEALYEADSAFLANYIVEK